ncbi:hypothetical protein ACIPC1_39385 [Streptomyces sp. NPDC087263]|uniref:hypothetical protein n=1 Tax=Streptomyces sp. NPDC087263 TaxID=3365773 RepID=UPI0038094C89
MDADDRTGPRQWTTTSPEHFDWLARAVLRAARDAARELRRESPDPDRRTWALGKLAGQIQAMLGPDLPDHPPAGAAAQEEFVRTALALAVQVRAHSWAMADLGPLGVLGQADVPHPGERQAADAFDVLGRLMLPDSSSEGWTATLVTDLARGDEKLEAVVKLGKYVLHPTFLALADDVTGVTGEALHSINVTRLYDLTRLLRHYSDPRPPHPAAVQVPTSAVGVPEPTSYSQPVTQSESPGSKFDDPLPIYPPHVTLMRSPDPYTPKGRRSIFGKVPEVGENRVIPRAPSPDQSETGIPEVPVLGDKRARAFAPNPDQSETVMGPLVDEPDDLDPDIPGYRNLRLDE